VRSKIPDPNPIIREPVSRAERLVLRYLPLFVIVAPVLMILGAAACAPKHLSPAAQNAFSADQVVIRLGELQDTAIAANANGTLLDKDAIAIVKFTVAGAKTAKTVPSGWRQTLRASWTELKASGVGAGAGPGLAAIRAAFAAVDALLGGV